MGPGMRQVVGLGVGAWEEVIFGANVGSLMVYNG